MIYKLSKKLATLYAKKSKKYNDTETCEYGFFIILSNVFYFILILFFGFIFNVVIQSLIFYVAFIAIRQIAGGYHASTEIRCEIISFASFLISIGIIKSSQTYDLQLSLLYITIASIICIFVFSPLDTPEKPLSEKELYNYRKTSRLILLIISALVIISYIFEWKVLFAPLCLSLILESILLIAGKVKKVYQLKNAKQ